MSISGAAIRNLLYLPILAAVLSAPSYAQATFGSITVTSAMHSFRCESVSRVAETPWVTP